MRSPDKGEPRPPRNFPSSAVIIPSRADAIDYRGIGLLSIQTYRRHMQRVTACGYTCNKARYGVGRFTSGGQSRDSNGTYICVWPSARRQSWAGVEAYTKSTNRGSGSIRNLVCKLVDFSSPLVTTTPTAPHQRYSEGTQSPSVELPAARFYGIRICFRTCKPSIQIYSRVLCEFI